MPAVARFRGFTVYVYPADHRPAHVHVEGGGVMILFYLNCWAGPVTVRQRFGGSSKTERAVANFLNENLQSLCTAWETFHGEPG